MLRATAMALIWVAALLIWGGAPKAVLALVTFERSDLVVETAGGPVRFSVEVARTNEQRMQGLMFRDRLAADAGMLFVYEHERDIDMWMRNTVIPLDMLFIGRDGRITRIVQRTIPLSSATIGSDGPARAVLELNGGTAAQLGIKPGDRVRSRELDGGS